MLGLTQNQCEAELRRILEQSLECANRLDDLLASEREALESQQSEQLRAISTSKELCVQCLQNLEAERCNLCATAGYDVDQSAMQELLSWCDKNSASSTLWTKLLEVAKRCELINRSNGAIARARHQQVMSALTLLNGGSSGAPLYRSDGRESSRFGQRALARI